MLKYVGMNTTTTTINNNEILPERKPLVYTRARRAVQKKAQKNLQLHRVISDVFVYRKEKKKTYAQRQKERERGMSTKNYN